MQLSNCGGRVGKTEGSVGSRAPDAQTGPAPEGVPASSSQGRYLKHRRTDRSHKQTISGTYPAPHTALHSPSGLFPWSVLTALASRGGENREGSAFEEHIQVTPLRVGKQAPTCPCLSRGPLLQAPPLSATHYQAHTWGCGSKSRKQIQHIRKSAGVSLTRACLRQLSHMGK